MEKKRPLVINLSGGPGSGKSTLAAELFVFFKKGGYNVELVREYAKELVWANDLATLSNQLAVTTEQCRRQDILRDSVDIIITDSPIYLGLAYRPNNMPEAEYHQLVGIIGHSWLNYDNLIVGLWRHSHYSPLGRQQTHEEARVMDEKIEGISRSIGGIDIHYSPERGGIEDHMPWFHSATFGKFSREFPRPTHERKH